MKTSLLTPVCVLLCLAALLPAAANASVLLPAADADTMPIQPVARRLPGSVKLSLPQALRATSLAAPSLQAPAEWLAHMQRPARSDNATPPPAPDSARAPAAVPG